MSVKRSSSLQSKWKLSKANVDYKENRILRKQGGAGYTEEPVIIKSKPVKKNPCKKLRGEHKWVLQPHHRVKLLDKDNNFYKCEGCGKELSQRKYKYVCKGCESDEMWMWFCYNVDDRKKCKRCGSYDFEEVAIAPPGGMA